MNKVVVPTSVVNVSDVYEFFKALAEQDLFLHPDDTFANCINLEQSSVSLNEDTIKHLDDVLDRCHEVCDQFGEDIYEIAYKVLTTALKK